jgi:hypothetical protein
VKEAGTVESLPVLAASQRLDTTTLFGRFRVDPVTGVQTGHQIRVVQWRSGQRVLVDRPLRRWWASKAHPRASVGVSAPVALS